MFEEPCKLYYHYGFSMVPWDVYTLIIPGAFRNYSMHSNDVLIAIIGKK